MKYSSSFDFFIEHQVCVVNNRFGVSLIISRLEKRCFHKFFTKNVHDFEVKMKLINLHNSLIRNGETENYN